MLKTNLAYALGSAANSAALFVLIPYLVNALPPSAYGAWAIYEVVLLLLTMLMTASMEVGMMREYWFLEDEPSRQRLAGSVLVAVVGWALTLTLGAGALAMQLDARAPGWLAAYGGVPGALLILVAGMLDAVMIVFLTVLRIREQALLYVVFSTTKLLLLVGAVIASTQLFGGIEGALLGRCLAALPPLVVAAWMLRGYFTPTFDRNLLGRVLRYGLPLLPAGFATYVLFASDRYVLQAVTSLEVAAIYAFAYKIATILDVLVTRPFSLDWAARRFKIATQEDAQTRYVQALLIYLFVAGAVALLIMAGTPLIYALVAPPVYAEGARAVPVILVAYLIFGLGQPLNVGLMLRDKTIYLPFIGALSAIVCIGLNLWLIPAYGFMGAAWATVAAYVIWTAAVTLFSLHYYPIAYPPLLVLGLLGLISLGFVGLGLLETSGAGAEQPVVAFGLRLAWASAICALMGASLLRRLPAGFVALIRQLRPRT